MDIVSSQSLDVVRAVCVTKKADAEPDDVKRSRRHTPPTRPAAGDRERARRVSRSGFHCKPLQVGSSWTRRDLNLPSLQDRRREKRLVFLYKLVEGLIPAIPAESLTPVWNKKQIKTTSRSDFTSSNIIRRFARSNSRCFSLDGAKTDTHKNIFFIRTAVSDWNNLAEEVVSAKSVEEF